MYLKHIVKEDESGRTAEYILRQKLAVSNRLCKRIRDERALKSNGVHIFNKAIVSAGDILEVNYFEDNEPRENLQLNVNIEVLFEDEWYIIVNKPPLLPTHPRFPGDPALTTVLSDYNLRASNRLDTGTSGIVVLAKNAYAHDLITKVPMHKIYIGLVHDIVKPADGIFNAPIGREEGTIIFRKVREDGKAAKTHYRSLASWEDNKVTLLAYLLETGRTHQIRVHNRYFGHPMVGDQFYGWEQTYRFKAEVHDGKTGYYLQRDDRNFKDASLERDFQALKINRELQRQFLHAYILCLNHPITQEKLFIKADIADDLSRLLDKLQKGSEQNIDYSKITELLEIKVSANVVAED